YKWDDSLEEAIDYNTYIKEYIWPNPNKDKAVKQKQKDMICGFLDFLQQSNHPLYPEVQEHFDRVLTSFQKQETLIFPSFYRLLENLDERGISYTLVFRTFGNDMPEIAKELNKVFGEGFL